MTFTWDKITRFKIYSLVAADRVGIKNATLEVLYQNNEVYIENYLQQQTQKEVDNINARDVRTIPEEELHELTKQLSDYVGLSHETKEVLSHYIIVAAFSSYEKGLKKILELTNKLTDQELRSCYKKENLTQLLARKFSINYSALADYINIEELRCLNNDIKHNGVVSPELIAANTKWILSQPIENTYNDFLRLKNAPRNLLVDLSTQLQSHL